MPAPPSALPHLIARLETHLGWGAASGWSSYDLERLSELIARQTGVALSVSTLKRVLGKVDYKSAPSQTTLNALARFVGFTDWRSFQQSASEPEPASPGDATTGRPSRISSRSRRRQRLVGGFSVGLLGLLGWRLWLLYQPAYRPVDFQFRSTTVLTQGVPNSVVFSYDAHNARPGDSVFICQSWDAQRKVLVARSDHRYSAIYYYPGFFRAKLLVGRQVLQAHDLQINTDGWLGLVEADWGQEPTYFKTADIHSTNGASIRAETLTKYNVSQTGAAPKLWLLNQKAIQGIRSDCFTFETQVRSLSSRRGCQRIDVMLQAKNDFLQVPLVSPGCVGDIAVAASGSYADSRRADLRRFGCALDEWTDLRIRGRDGQIQFYVNGRLVYQARRRNRPVDIIGVNCRFRGPGMVRNTRLRGTTAAGEVVF